MFFKEGVSFAVGCDDGDKGEDKEAGQDVEAKVTYRSIESKSLFR